MDSGFSCRNKRITKTMNALFQKWIFLYNLGILYKNLKKAAVRISAMLKSEGGMSKTITQSKKSWAFLVSVASLFMIQFLGMPQESVDSIMKAIQVIAGSYFGAQTVHDVFLASTQPKMTVVASPNETINETK